MRKTALGFTLIELLVVISIIGILATLVAADLNSARSRARDTERKSDLKNIQTALRLYYNDYGSYPASNSSGDILGCGTSGTSACTWGSEWAAGPANKIIYMPVLPADPSSVQTYFYLQGADTDSYTISACLENASDTSGKNLGINGWNCSSSWVFQVSQ